MKDICEGTTWVVWLDYRGKWHSSDFGCFPSPIIDEGTRQFARALVGDSKGTASFIGTAKVAYCIHTRGRYQAIKMAKTAYKAKLLHPSKNGLPQSKSGRFLPYV